MPASTPNRNYPYPLGADPVDAAGDIQRLAEALDLDQRQTIKADTSASYTLILSDENALVTLSNAGPISVILPTDLMAAFPAGAEVDFLWLGAGQPTFSAAWGATVNGTPGLLMRAQYSAATAKKLAPDTWIVVGDLSA